MDNKIYYSFARELRCRYSLHVLLVVPISLTLSFLITEEAISLAVLITIITTVGFYLIGFADVMDVYRDNQINAERLVIKMYRHRDVFSWNTDPAHHWRFAKSCGLYRHVRPYYYLTLLLTGGFCLLFSEKLEEPAHLVGIPLIVLGIILSVNSNRYVDKHLHCPEARELHTNTENYSRMLDHAKQEAHQNRQAALIEEQLKQEQARNQGFPPTDDSQSHRPPKPY